MKRLAASRKVLGSWAVCAVAMLIAPTVAPARQDRVAREPIAVIAQETIAARDVALQPGGMLQGAVVDNGGMPQANFEVWIVFDSSGETIKTRTDASGRFAASGISPGLCTIDTPCGGGKFRLWEAKSAPRDAQTSVLLVVCAKPAG